MADEQVINILMVEDNPGDVLLTREALSDLPFHINLESVPNGLQAMSFLRKEGQYPNVFTPNLILLDLNMPRMNGRELLRRIKEDRELCTLPVIVLSTSSSQSDIEDCYGLRASAFVVKPVNFEKFQDVVTKISEFWCSIAQLPRSPDQSSRQSSRQST